MKLLNSESEKRIVIIGLVALIGILVVFFVANRFGQKQLKHTGNFVAKIEDSANRNEKEDFKTKGKYFLDRKDYQTAVYYLQKVIAKNPNDAEARYLLGLAYIKLNDKASALEEYKIPQGVG